MAGDGVGRVGWQVVDNLEAAIRDCQSLEAELEDVAGGFGGMA